IGIATPNSGIEDLTPLNHGTVKVTQVEPIPEGQVPETVDIVDHVMIEESIRDPSGAEIDAVQGVLVDDRIRNGNVIVRAGTVVVVSKQDPIAVVLGEVIVVGAKAADGDVIDVNVR